MIADGLTKDSGDPIDLLRVCISHAEYHISPESVVLERQAQDRARKKQATLNRVNDITADQ